MSSLHQLVKKYYKTGGKNFPQTLINDLQSTFWPLDEKKEDYKKYQSKIEILQGIFAEIIKTRNIKAQKLGFENYFFHKAKENGIPKRHLAKWLKDKGKSACEKIIKNIQLPSKAPEGFWTEFNVPSLYDLYPTQKKLSRDEVFLQTLKRLNATEELYKKINIKEHSLYYPKSSYSTKTQTAEIKIDFNNRIEDAVLLAHEIGHSIAYLKLMEKNIDPETKSNYWHEQQAFKAEASFISTLNKSLQQITDERILYYHIRSVFEYHIYSNPKGDFSKYYADVHNTYYCGQQKLNPFYVLDIFFIEEPCYSTIYAVLADQ